MKAKYFALGIAFCFAPAASCARHSAEQPRSATYKLGAVCAAPCITLTGHVKRELNYGPPGFGESPEIDRKIIDYILVLDNQINIRASKYVNPKQGVKEIQLFLPFDNNPLAKKIGRVEVRGTIEEASTAVAVRDYTLTVYSLRFLR